MRTGLNIFLCVLVFSFSTSSFGVSTREIASKKKSTAKKVNFSPTPIDKKLWDNLGGIKETPCHGDTHRDGGPVCEFKHVGGMVCVHKSGGKLIPGQSSHSYECIMPRGIPGENYCVRDIYYALSKVETTTQSDRNIREVTEGTEAYTVITKLDDSQNQQYYLWYTKSDADESKGEVKETRRPPGKDTFSACDQKDLCETFISIVRGGSNPDYFFGVNDNGLKESPYCSKFYPKTATTVNGDRAFISNEKAKTGVSGGGAGNIQNNVNSDGSQSQEVEAKP